MKELRKFPKVLTGVMLVLMGEQKYQGVGITPTLITIAQSCPVAEVSCRT